MNSAHLQNKLTDLLLENSVKKAKEFVIAYVLQADFPTRTNFCVFSTPWF